MERLFSPRRLAGSTGLVEWTGRDVILVNKNNKQKNLLLQCAERYLVHCDDACGDGLDALSERALIKSAPLCLLCHGPT